MMYEPPDQEKSFQWKPKDDKRERIKIVACLLDVPDDEKSAAQTKEFSYSGKLSLHASTNYKSARFHRRPNPCDRSEANRNHPVSQPSLTFPRLVPNKISFPSRRTSWCSSVLHEDNALLAVLSLHQFLPPS